MNNWLYSEHPGTVGPKIFGPSHCLQTMMLHESSCLRTYWILRQLKICSRGHCSESPIFACSLHNFYGAPMTVNGCLSRPRISTAFFFEHLNSNARSPIIYVLSTKFGKIVCEHRQSTSFFRIFDMPSTFWILTHFGCEFVALRLAWQMCRITWPVSGARNNRVFGIPVSAWFTRSL